MVKIVKWTKDNMVLAFKDIKAGRLSYGQCALKYMIPRSTLHRYVKKANTVEDITILFEIQSGRQMMLSREDEETFSKFLDEQSIGYYGLSLSEVRRKVYEYALKRNRKVYGARNTASYKWLKSFSTRNNFVKRKPQHISLARARAISKTSLNGFYDKLEFLMNKYDFPASRVYNVDETGVTTVPPHRSYILAKRSNRKVQHISTAERGSLITVILGMNVSGEHIPPAIVYPRKNQKDISKCLPEDYVLFYSKNGWSNTEIFLKYMRHFIKHAKPSEDSPILLTFDNHVSHLDRTIVDIARQNNVHILTIIPHSSHILSPLDVGFNKGFKQNYSDMLYKSMRENQDVAFLMKDSINIIKQAFEKSAINNSNAINAFRTCGIFPVNRSALNKYIFAVEEDVQIDSEIKDLAGRPKFKAALPSEANKLQSALILTADIPTQNAPDIFQNKIRLTIKKLPNGEFMSTLN